MRCTLNLNERAFLQNNFFSKSCMKILRKIFRAKNHDQVVLFKTCQRKLVRHWNNI